MGDSGRRNPYIHTDFIYSGSVCRILQSADADANTAGSEQLDIDPLYQSSNPADRYQRIPVSCGNGHGYDTGNPHINTDPASDCGKYRCKSSTFWNYNGGQSGSWLRYAADRR